MTLTTQIKVMNNVTVGADMVSVAAFCGGSSIEIIVPPNCHTLELSVHQLQEFILRASPLPPEVLVAINKVNKEK